jgi:hypothetical protein
MLHCGKEYGWGMTDRAGPSDRDTDNTNSPHGSYSGRGDPHPSDSPDLRQLAQDWITLWQSELTAMAQDREAQETWQAMLALLAGMAGAWLSGMPAGHGETRGNDERAGKRAGAEPAPRPEAAPAAPGPRDAEIERLARHVAALEARLAELEHGSRPRQPDRRKR